MPNDNVTGHKPRMTRKQLGEFLRASGYPISDSILNKLCAPSVGAGPPVDAWWGARPLYTPDAGITWAERRLRPARASDQLSASA
jgi:hypothetical protein